MVRSRESKGMDRCPLTLPPSESTVLFDQLKNIRGTLIKKTSLY
jgi:hypothetical protein